MCAGTNPRMIARSTPAAIRARGDRTTYAWVASRIRGVTIGARRGVGASTGELGGDGAGDGDEERGLAVAAEDAPDNRLGDGAPGVAAAAGDASGKPGSGGHPGGALIRLRVHSSSSSASSTRTSSSSVLGGANRSIGGSPARPGLAEVDEIGRAHV